MLEQAPLAEMEFVTIEASVRLSRNEGYRVLIQMNSRKLIISRLGLTHRLQPASGRGLLGDRFLLQWQAYDQSSYLCSINNTRMGEVEVAQGTDK